MLELSIGLKLYVNMSRSRKVYLEIQEKQVLFEIYQIPQSNPFNVAILNHRLHVVKHILENEYNTDRWGLIYVVLSDVYWWKFSGKVKKCWSAVGMRWKELLRAICSHEYVSFQPV